jgi:tRNA-specific 2-thiouridylase
MNRETIAIAMSGGVDSSVAAVILKEAGYDLAGYTMRLWDPGRGAVPAGAAPAKRYGSAGDLRDAADVAARLGIPHRVVDLQKEFERTVVRPFIEDYRSGRTPSPCVLCNAGLKFGRLVRLAAQAGASRVATGHYARVSLDEKSGRHLLLKARDANKDQSYFLFQLSQSQLAKAVFPLGELRKDQVRSIARKHGLAVAEKTESQEICFIPDGDYASFIERHCDGVMGSAPGTASFPPGPIVDRSGRVLGTHLGIHRYTVGQRRGLGVAHTAPLYVLEICPGENRVVVGERSELGGRRCRVVRPNWIAIPSLTEPLRVRAKIRSRHREAPAVIAPRANGDVEVLFEEPQPAITPGQACVFYQDAKVVGGGWIDRD